MSTVPEAISARHAGLEVAALSVVTNLAAGLAAEPLTHAETLGAARRRLWAASATCWRPPCRRSPVASPDLRTLLEAARRAPVTPDLAARAMALIDLTSLGGGETPAEIERLCARAVAHGTAAVCIYAEARAAAPRTARRQRRSASPRSPTSRDGGDDIAAAAEETAAAVAAGADEVDVVAPDRRPCSRAMSGLVGELVEACRAAAGPGITLKLILETGELQEPDLITAAARAAVMAGVDFLKTSTGKTEVGATLEAAAALLAVMPRGRRAGRLQGRRRHPHARPTPRAISHSPTRSWARTGPARAPSASAPRRCSTICWAVAAAAGGY